jgi:hypothetical protein
MVTRLRTTGHHAQRTVFSSGFRADCRQLESDAIFSGGPVNNREGDKADYILGHAGSERTQLLLQVGGGVQHDVQGRNLLRLHVSVDQESLAILGYIIGERIGRRNLGA